MTRHDIIQRIVAVSFCIGLTACGGAAPGEGMETAMAPEPMPEVVSAIEAVTSAAIPAVDPESMHDAEIDKVLGSQSYCGFSYSTDGGPILAGTADDGTAGRAVVKIHGRLVELALAAGSPDTLEDVLRYNTDGIDIAVRLLSKNGTETIGPKKQEAEMIFELEQGLTVGYRGWYRCLQG